jgi:predicted HTH domain antitoxin
MSSVALSVRMDRDEVKQVDEWTRICGLDRSALLKQCIRSGLKKLRLEQSMSAYRAGEISLSRAAELSKLSVREFLLQLAAFGTELNYDVAEFDADLAGSGL